MAEKILLELDLKTAKAMKKVGDLDDAIQDVGKDATKAGETGTEGFKKFGKSALGVFAQVTGISVGLAGVIGLMKQVHENQLLINTASAEAIRQQQDRIRASGGILGSQLNRELAQQLKVSEAEAFRLTGNLSALHDIPHAQVQGALRDIIPRGGLGAEDIGDVLTFARGTAASAGASGQLFAILSERFGLRGAQRREAAAGIGAVADESATTPENLIRTLTPISSGLQLGGITDPLEQGALVAAFAQFEDPNAPELTKTALKQINRLGRQEADPFTAQLLRAVGSDPETFNDLDLIRAYQTFLQAVPAGDARRARIRELSTKTGIPPRVLDKIAATADASFNEVFNRSLAVGRAATFGDVAQRAAERASSPEAQTRSAETRRQIRRTVTGSIPGTATEANAILGRLTSQAGFEDPEATEAAALAFRGEAIEAGFGDERISAEDTRRLFFLLRVWNNTIEPALASIQAESGDAANSAQNLRLRGFGLEVQAKKFQFLGNQADFIDQFESFLSEAVRFIRQVQLGQPVKDILGLGSVESSAAESAAAAASGVAPLTAAQVRGRITPSGGNVTNIANNTNIINGADPATAPVTRDGTAGAPQ